MSVHAELPFERFRYWQGQMVRARDFTAQLAEAERLGRWHTRAIHNAFGVRFGFEVVLDTSAREARVRIECGVAFDCTGALLILQRPRLLVVPPLDPGESISLQVRTSGEGASGSAQHGVETSPSAGNPHLLEDDLKFVWGPHPSGDPRQGVVLARIARQDSGVVALDSTVHPLARPLARPQLGSGATIPGRTAWEPWAAGMQTRIDTSASGFTQTPSYVASLIATGEPLSFLQMPFFFTHITDPGLTGFTFRLLVPPIVRHRIASARVQLMADERRRRLARLRVVAEDRTTLAAFQPGDTVRLVAPDQEDALHRAPTAVIERVQADAGTLILRADTTREPGLMRESVDVVRLNSDDFQSRFAETSRNLGLMVCWFGCQGQEYAFPGCPGQRKVPRCCDTERGAPRE